MSEAATTGSGADDPDRRGEPFRILFVCTGNTCRSPLAEGITRDLLDRRGWDHVEVASAGAYAAAGAPASEGAARVALRHGLDLSEHRSTPLSPGIVDAADLILVMASSHLFPVMEMGGGGRASLLVPFAGGGEGADTHVPDPIGGSDEDYEATYRMLRSSLERVVERIEPLVAP